MLKLKEEKMTNLPKVALGAWAWGNDGTFGNLTEWGLPRKYLQDS